MSTIQVVLLVDVPLLGKAGESHIVKAGYGRNYLIPKGLAALVGTDQAKKVVKENVQKKEEVHKSQQDKEKSLGTLDGKKITFKVKVNKAGRPFKAITGKDIAQKLQIDKGLLKDVSIKKIGEHPLVIEKDKIKAKIIVDVQAEK